MKIYKGGECVKLSLSGANPQYNTYIAVLDNPIEKTIEQGINELKEYLTQHSSVVFDAIKTIGNVSITLNNGDVYTIAHDTIIENDNVIYLPCNMLRHCFNEMFTINSLYYDNNELIDLTSSGKYCVQHKELRSCKPINSYVKINPNLLVDMFYLKITEHYYFSGDIEHCFYDLRNIKSIDLNQETVDKIKTMFSPAFIINTLSCIGNYLPFFRYLINVCGLDFNMGFNSENIGKISLSNNEIQRYLQELRAIEVPNNEDEYEEEYEEEYNDEDDN